MNALMGVVMAQSQFVTDPIFSIKILTCYRQNFHQNEVFKLKENISLKCKLTCEFWNFIIKLQTLTCES